MADFEIAFNRTMKSEGGYVLHTVPGDRGGMTYAGISRKYNPDWDGWACIDSGEYESPELMDSVRSFYYDWYWRRIGGSDIDSQPIANVLFDFSVNSGVRTAVRLAQQVLGVPADGVIGSQTIGAINSVDSDGFVSHYALAKVARYAAIVNRDRSQNKFLLGWVNRTLRDLESA